MNSQGKPRCENEVVINTDENCVGDAKTKCPQYCDTACADFVADTIGQICQNVPGCEPDPDHDPFKYRERLGPASPPQTLPQPLPQPLRRNLRFGYKEDVFCPEGCKPKED